MNRLFCGFQEPSNIFQHTIFDQMTTFKTFPQFICFFRSIPLDKFKDISNLCNECYMYLFISTGNTMPVPQHVLSFALDQLPTGEFIGWTKRTFRSVAKLGERIKTGSQSEKHSKRSFYDDCSHNAYVIYGFRSKSLQQIVKILVKNFEWREKPRCVFQTLWSSAECLCWS